MKYEIVNVVNLTNSKLPSSKLLFDIKYGDMVVGSCQLSIENIFLQFKLEGDKGNFSFTPNDGHQRECADSEAVISNHLDVSEGINRNVSEKDTSRETENSLEDTSQVTKNANVNNRPDRNCLPPWEEIKIKLEEDVFNRHESNYIGNIQNNITQPSASKVSKRSASLHSNAHRRTQHGIEKPFKCVVCGKFFTRKSSFNTHMKIHDLEKALKCEICGKLFSQKFHLINHTRIHTGEKPFECQFCGRAFKEKSHLNKHKRTHACQKS